MTDHPTRLAYCHKANLDPDKIPGKACLRGEYDNAPGFREHEAEMLRNRQEAEEG